MPRPWTKDDDHTLGLMYTRSDTPMQLIRDTLHRTGPAIHERARQLGLVRPGREQKSGPYQAPRQQREYIGAHLELVSAVNALRRSGFSPVCAQRHSDSSTIETGLWVVGRKLLRPDELVEFAAKHGRR